MGDTIDIGMIGDLPPGEIRVIEYDDFEVAVINCKGELFAIEDRCSHDDGPLAEGILNEEDCTIECPRHGSLFDLRTGKPKTLPAYEPVETFGTRIEDGKVKVDME
ncbi:MAG TPA: non-heme iron oxygenase ferredoxin subunit [Baekduia sp.]|nr:non-heme iron oxygenase ferredoxin subunit [Baekduia sp.]